ncbi:MAG: family 20 glycosylhydrolase [Tannerellaceae bacterium]|jgi:hexosaminidase|nr:family 20 glycosylhydrolase [Tannerellaceae bacterium]
MKKQIYICASAALILLASCAKPERKSYNDGINIIPAPLSLTQMEGSFSLKPGTVFCASGAEAQTVAHFFAAKINASTGYQLAVQEAEGANSIALVIDRALTIGNEGYKLEVGADKVSVLAKSAQGLFYGMQSFMQLLPAEIESAGLVKGIEWTAPAVSIQDEPKYGYRGVMLDACRHFMPVEFVKRQLDILAMFKINRMHWHLTEDQGWRIEIKQYPKLTEIGSKGTNGEGFYTQAEIKEIVAYAAERFITIIPEVELPGHELAAIAAYPELSCTGEATTPRFVWGVEDVVLCAGKESTFEFLENVLKEVVPLFPSEYFHIGGDECPKSSWKACPLCQERIRKEGLKADASHSAEERLQSWFVQRMEKVLAGYGKRIIGWDEILEGGLAPSATVMSWRGEEGGIAAATLDHDVIMTPGRNNGMYIDQFQGDYKIEPVSIGGYNILSNVYKYNPTPEVLLANNMAHHILGVQCNLWAEYLYTPELMEYRLYPSALAVAEIGWLPADKKDFNDFDRRLNNALVRLDNHGANYHIPQPEQPGGSCNFIAFTDTARLEFKTTRPVTMVYTLNGDEPTPQSKQYSDPLTFAKNTTLKIRSVLPSGRMSPTRTITIEKQDYAPAQQIAQTMPGLQLKITYGEYASTEQIKDITDWQERRIERLEELSRLEPYSNSMRNFKQYAAVATGFVKIPEDAVYYIASDNEEVWIDGRLIVNNAGEVKRFSRHDKSIALAAGYHEIKVVFLGHIIGGWPSNWSNSSVGIRKEGNDRFAPISAESLVSLAYAGSGSSAACGSKI